MLDKIEEILREQNLVQQDWNLSIKAWGEAVALYRRYYDGEHKTFLTDEMRAMLRSKEGFQDNYCELVVNSMVDRLMVRSIEAEDAAAEWVAETREAVMYDALQLDVHQAVVRDGDTFVMVEYDEETQSLAMHHEEAWDGVEGIIPVYDRKRKNLLAAVKVWYEVEGRMVRFYYPDRTSKYQVLENDTGEKDKASGLNLVPVEGEIDVAWAAGVVPLVHFKNRAGSRSTRGISEIRAAIPLQDVLNRTLVSMVMTSEMSAFSVRYAVGFQPPQKLAPGSWVIAGAEGVPSDATVEMGTLDQAEMVPFIDQAAFIIDQIGTVTLTPLPTLMGGKGESGEALKERQTGLTGKVRRAQTRLGVAWAEVWRVGQTVFNTYSTQNIPSGRFVPRWADAQLRNEVELREHAKEMREAGYEREFLRIMGQVLGYDGEKIDQLIAEKREAEAASLAALGGAVPGFDNFLTPQ